MKLFIYKTLIITFLILLTFQLTIGSKINNIKAEIEKLSSPQKINEFKIKLFDEIKKANKKENYFSPAEREELSNFIKKIQKELID
tara:strand:+ start:3790 stop:4047 length:258 start_codon:yes stop_codon:yes gene_type:complete